MAPHATFTLNLPFGWIETFDIQNVKSQQSSSFGLCFTVSANSTNLSPLTQAVLTSNSLDNSQILFNFADNLANLEGTAFHF